MIDYYLNSAANGPVTLEILDAAGKVVRTYSSAEGGGGGGGRRGGGGVQNIPAYWNRTPETFSAAAGMHRWTWDVHYAPAAGGGGGRGGGGGGGGGIWALPGTYTVKLTVDGKSYTQPLTVKMDPQVKTTLPELQRQLDIANQVSAKSADVAKARGEVTRVRAQITSLRTQVSSNPALLASLDALDKKAAEIGGVTAPSTPDSSGVASPSADVSSLMFVGGELGQVL